MELRQIFNAKISPTKAMGRMNKWYEKVMALGNNNFRSVIKTFKNHAQTILNYFRRRATNASAEAFNSKVKIFRSQMRGVRDRDFFIFRLVKLYAWALTFQLSNFNKCTGISAWPIFFIILTQVYYHAPKNPLTPDPLYSRRRTKGGQFWEKK